MRIACPACNAVYEIPPALLGTAPRTLRCARCGHEWSPDTAPPPPPPEPASRPAPPDPPPVMAPRNFEPSRLHHPPAPPRGSGMAVAATLLCSVLVLAAAAAAAYAWRNDIMTLWPPSTQLFAVLGLR